MTFHCCNGKNEHNSNCTVVNQDLGLAAVAFYVEDVSKTVEFYSKVFNGILLFADPEDDFASMQIQGLNLQFIREAAVKKLYDKFIENRRDAERKPGLEVIFPVDDPVLYYQDILKRAKDLGYDIGCTEPVEQPYGAIAGWVTDINGICLCITGKMPNLAV